MDCPIFCDRLAHDPPTSMTEPGQEIENDFHIIFDTDLSKVVHGAGVKKFFFDHVTWSFFKDRFTILPYVKFLGGLGRRRWVQPPGYGLILPHIPTRNGAVFSVYFL